MNPIEEILRLEVPDLLKRSRLGVRLFPDVKTMLDFMADCMAEELRHNNAAGKPTRWILPVGPINQYFRLVEISNREKISWKNADIFQMDDFLDWQGRPVPLDHPLSFQGFVHKQVFAKLEAGLRPNPERVHFPNPFQPDEIAAKMIAAGGVDTCYGGIGYHGHVAFNEPPLSRWSQNQRPRNARFHYKGCGAG